DEGNPRRLGRGELTLDVVGFETEVVHSFAALLEEARDRPLRVDRLEELDLGMADAEERRTYPLIAHLGRLVDLEAESVAVEAVRVLEAANHDAHVVDPLQHGSVSGDASLAARDQSRYVSRLGVNPLLIDS